jgi:hypothetical protein
MVGRPTPELDVPPEISAWAKLDALAEIFRYGFRRPPGCTNIKTQAGASYPHRQFWGIAGERRCDGMCRSGVCGPASDYALCGNKKLQPAPLLAGAKLKDRIRKSRHLEKLALAVAIRRRTTESQRQLYENPSQLMGLAGGSCTRFPCEDAGPRSSQQRSGRM